MIQIIAPGFSHQLGLGVPKITAVVRLFLYLQLNAWKVKFAVEAFWNLECAVCPRGLGLRPARPLYRVAVDDSGVATERVILSALRN